MHNLIGHANGYGLYPKKHISGDWKKGEDGGGGGHVDKGTHPGGFQNRKIVKSWIG